MSEEMDLLGSEVEEAGNSLVRVNPAVERIAGSFAIAGDLVDYKEVHSGHINTTFMVTYSDQGQLNRYIMQRINEQVFKSPHEVIQNVGYVTKHINSKVLRHRRDMGGADPQFVPVT